MYAGWGSEGRGKPGFNTCCADQLKLFTVSLAAGWPSPTDSVLVYYVTLIAEYKCHSPSSAAGDRVVYAFLDRFSHLWSHTPSTAFRHLPPKEGCRKPVLGICYGHGTNLFSVDKKDEPVCLTHLRDSQRNLDCASTEHQPTRTRFQLKVPRF